MNIDKIRKNKPEGATHYDTDKLFGLTYWMVCGDMAKMYCLGVWSSGRSIKLKRTITGRIYIGSFFDRLYLEPL